MFVQKRYPICIIARPKLAGAGEHWGVLLPNGMVAHNTPTHGEHVSSYADFERGLRVRVVERIHASQDQAILQRVRLMQVAPRPYHATANNCEMLATRLVGKAPESPQVRGWLILAGLVTVASLSTR